MFEFLFGVLRLSMGTRKQKRYGIRRAGICMTLYLAFSIFTSSMLAQEIRPTVKNY